MSQQQLEQYFKFPRPLPSKQDKINSLVVCDTYLSGFQEVSRVFSEKQEGWGWDYWKQNPSTSTNKKLNLQKYVSVADWNCQQNHSSKYYSLFLNHDFEDDFKYFSFESVTGI